MKNNFKSFSIWFFLALFGFSLTVWADGETSGDVAKQVATKFGRGLWNVVSSPAEIPCTISDDMHQNAGTGFFTGFGKGIALMLRRILVGVTEVGTFMIPMEATIPPVCKNKS